MLAVKELLGSRLKFGLIALAIGLVVSLTMLMSAMSEGLVTGMTGAKGSLAADALVFQADTYVQLERSLLSAEDLAAISVAEGVREAYGVGHAIVTVDSAEERFDARVFGLGGRFDQLPIVEGAGGEPGRREAIVDVTAAVNGVEVGDTLHLTPIDEEITVIGFTEDRRYTMAPAVYVDLATWEELYLSGMLSRMAGGGGEGTPDAGTLTARTSGGASIAAVELAEGVTPDDLAASLGEGFEVVTPEEAAMAGSGMNVMVLATNGIQAVSLLIGALVIGVFFYVTTLHKTAQVAAIKALGASSGYLYRQLLAQITILVTVAAVLGTLLALGAGRSMPPTMAFDPRPARWALSLAAVYATAYLGSVFSLASILRIDPAAALSARSGT
ncbi:MAG: ABC transporter permease [Coriobacteriia bacterium]|nr:ABC transporter permease [Coriobacteriia bacterium]